MLSEAEIKALVDDWYARTTPEQQAAMWKAQRESWQRAMEPCEHGGPGWETCPQCLDQLKTT